MQLKYIIYIFFSLILPFKGVTQELKIVDSKLTIESEVGSQISTNIKVQNVSDHIIVLGIIKSENNIRSSQVSKFCLDNDCTEKDIVSTDVFIKLMPNQVYDGFLAQLETGLVPGNSSVKYVFYNTSNTNERIEADLNYIIKEKTKEGVLYSSADIKLSDVFPNPVKEIAIFNYNYYNPDKEVKLVIHSVLGSIVSEFDLSPYESSLKIPVNEYNPGVYFYTLYIENEGVATKKMVVRK